ncbi:MAG: DUF3836 domain-containing protein [Bacteroides sp.]|nr:DUF3836 domain-containing protein [Bacteroides sp.]
MKTTSLFQAVAFVAMIIVSVMNSEVKAQESNFITNEEVKNELVVAKTIFKQDGGQLYRHIRYEYTYDDQKRLTSKEASKWDGAKDEWVPYFKMTYQYGNDEITMSYARWNQSHKAFDKDMKKSVYELSDENMPVACKFYNQDVQKSDLTMVSYNKKDYVANLLAMAR